MCVCRCWLDLSCMPQLGSLSVSTPPPLQLAEVGLHTWKLARICSYILALLNALMEKLTVRLSITGPQQQLQNCLAQWIKFARKRIGSENQSDSRVARAKIRVQGEEDQSEQTCRCSLCVCVCVCVCACVCVCVSRASKCRGSDRAAG